MRLMLLLLAAYLALSACSNQVSSTPTLQIEIGDGKSSISGRVLSSITSLPLANTSVRLAEVYRQGEDGAFLLDGARSPGALTNEAGYFEIANIAVAEYVIIVGDIYGEHRIIAEPTGQAKVWKTIPDQKLNVGDLVVDLP
jgi:hypothetical protein